MAFRNVAALLAEGVALDRITDRLTAFNMLETMLAPSFPAVIGKLVVINLYEVDGPREPTWERVTVLDGGGAELAQTRTELVGEGEAHRSMVLFQGVRLVTPGVYTVRVETAPAKVGPWREVAHRRLLAAERPHPLARADEKNPAAGKVSGPSSITD